MPKRRICGEAEAGGVFERLLQREEESSSNGESITGHPQDLRYSKGQPEVRHYDFESHSTETMPPRLPLVKATGGLNVQLRGYPKLRSYWEDSFHTLINIPNARFYPLLVVVYSILFGAFAIPYYSKEVSGGCVPGIKNYAHAVWFSVQSSMTIGFGGDLTPDPECTALNALLMIQSLASLLVAYSMLGVVYARFALPTRRASTLVFSRYMTIHWEDGVPLLSFRVANVRKHQIIDVHARMLVAINNVFTDENEAIFRFQSLSVQGGSQAFLGLPCVVTHPVTQDSPLHGMSDSMMDRCDIEFLVLLEGVDASTSAKLQARHSYLPRDIKYNCRFSSMVTIAPNGRRTIDFAKFNLLVASPSHSLSSPTSTSSCEITHHLLSRPSSTPAVGATTGEGHQFSGPSSGFDVGVPGGMKRSVSYGQHLQHTMHHTSKPHSHHSHQQHLHHHHHRHHYQKKAHQTEEEEWRQREAMEEESEEICSVRHHQQEQHEERQQEQEEERRQDALPLQQRHRVRWEGSSRPREAAETAESQTPLPPPLLMPMPSDAISKALESHVADEVSQSEQEKEIRHKDSQVCEKLEEWKRAYAKLQQMFNELQPGSVV